MMVLAGILASNIISNTTQGAAWIAAAGYQKMTQAQMNACDTFINGCTTDSTLTKIQIFAPLVGVDLASALLPFIGSTLSAIGGLTYGDYAYANGFTTTSAKMLSTGVGVGSNVGSGHLIYTGTSGVTSPMWGAMDAGTNARYGTLSAATGPFLAYYSANGSPNVVTGDVTSPAGCYHVESPASTGTGRMALNGAAQTPTWTTPSIGTTPNTYVGGYNNNGTAAGTAMKVGCFIQTDGSCSATDMTNLAARVATLMTAFGR